MLKTKRLSVLMIFSLLVSIWMSFAAVEFTVTSDNLNPTVGQSFNLLVELTIPAAEEIKSAEFTLTPNVPAFGADRNNVGTPDGLLGGAPNLNLVASGLFRYAEATTGNAVSGSNKLLVTIPVTVNQAGEATFTFSGLVASKGRTPRDESSIPLSIVVAGAACTPSCPLPNTICKSITDTRNDGCGGTCNVAGTKEPLCSNPATVACGTPLSSTNECSGCLGTGTQCPGGQSCNAAGVCQVACVNRPATCLAAGLTCPDTVIPQLVCPGGQSCDAAGVCQAGAPSTLGAQIDSGLTQAEKTERSWSIALISKIAALLKSWFS